MTHPKTIKELEKIIQTLGKKYHAVKVNLVHDAGNEGIWAVPVDETSAQRLKCAGSIDEFAYVRVCSLPLGWNGLTWGGLVKARTRGQKRPWVQLEDQDEKDLKNDRDVLQTLIAKMKVGIES